MSFQKTNSRGSTSGNVPRYGIQIGYRTLSIRLEERQLPAKHKPSTDPADAIASIDVHLITPEDIYTRYSTHPDLGLESVAVQRRSKDGKNVISPPPTQYWKKALNYVFGGFNFLMWVAFILTIASTFLSYKPLGQPPEVFVLGVAVLLILVIVVSATFYAVVDWNSSRVMKSIKSLIAHDACVVRDGKQQIINASDIVIGDVVILNHGDRVPADLRIVQASSDLRFDRSLLTGESDMVPGALDATSDNALETRNLALTSTFVVQGTCTGVAFATGDRTVMGRLVSLSGEKKFKLTTIQKEIWFFTKIISALALFFFCLSLLLYGVWLRSSFPGYDTTSTAIVNSIGCLTAFVPQGLPVCVALSLSVVARRMAKRHVLVKNLATIETLGSGKMMVENIAFLNNSLNLFTKLHDFVTRRNSILPRCLGQSKSGMSRAIQPTPPSSGFTEMLSIPSLGINTETLAQSWIKQFEIPFNSRNKWALAVVTEKGSGSTWMLIKGAPDILFPSCSSVMRSNGSVIPFGNNERRSLSALQDEWSSQGQRVIALCRKPFDGFKPGLPPNDMEDLMYSEMQDMTLVGLVGIRDPPREDVPAAIAVIRRAGVRVFMVTGDFKLTAVAIARQVGIISQQQIDTILDVRVASSEKVSRGSRHVIKPAEDDPIHALVLTGEDVSSLTPAEWDVIVGSYTEIVFARTTPEQKMKIVEEIKYRGDNTVAVTGDGVNDAPALKAADIGVAMGAGSDVAKEAAALILLKNDFASIPVAIEMGRLVFDNLKKVTLYLMPAGSYTEFMAVLSNVLLGMQLPMTTYQQVAFCITNDVVMSVSLMYEKAEADLMLRKPRQCEDRSLGRLAPIRPSLPGESSLFIGLMLWPSAMGMWFLYMHQQGLGFYDVILVFNKWQDGWQGYSIDQLTDFVHVGTCIYYVTLVIGQYGSLLSVRNRRVSTVQSSPLWGPRRNLIVPCSMAATAVIAVINLYGPGLQRVFDTTPIPGMFWGLPFCFALGILVMDELRKLVVRTWPKSVIAWLAW
ncbi:calcium ATPase transmembrane domain M-containing protein [Phlebopus sp. FC_14]|nr:calcium ATPase transmembrane domain M-containing protein [Phlebopus sp. FC_14]